MDTNLNKKILKDFQLFSRSQALYFDLKEIKSKFDFLDQLSSDYIRFLFPVKSFPHKVIIDIADKYLYGHDISNAKEGSLLRASSFTWNSSPWLDIDNASKNQFVDINSINDLGKIPEDISALRVNTDFLNFSSRFGLKKGEIYETLRNTKINALHIHYSSQDNTVSDYKKMTDFFYNLQSEIPRQYHFNFGGGLAQLDNSEVKEVVEYAKQTLKGHYIYFEPGRWLAQDSGHAVGRILSINKDFVITTLSPSCHLKWIDKSVDISFASKNDKSGIMVKDVVLCGPTCYEADKLVTVSDYNKTLSIGDLIIVSQISGYSQAWNHSFNGIEEAEIIFLES